MFPFVNAILLKRLAVSEQTASRLQTYRAANAPEWFWSLGTVDELAKRDPALNGVYGWFRRSINISISAGEMAHWLNGKVVT
jgi:hypothetical protein